MWYLLSYLSKMSKPRLKETNLRKVAEIVNGHAGPQPTEPDCKAPARPLQAAASCFGTGLSPHSSMLAEPPLMLASLQAFFSPARTQLQPLPSAIHLLSKYLLRVYDVPRTVLGVRDTKINKIQL